ncbi:3-isopropylmalate dehydrogenase [Tepidibacter sp. Z1-5]|uniref:3-isopropylmalate dehydrogenase n=1 Tax=Tepidibacter sp. Z1-5 TaxID=3134138 RepID=UPI0030C205B9
MDFNIAVLKGDGIGPEVINQALLVLDKIGKKYNHQFDFKEALIGGQAIDTVGENLPKETIDICKESDAILLGAVGGPKWDGLSGEKRPEKGLLKIRKILNLYANIRPAILFKELKKACPLKDEIIGDGIDICVVRELTGGIYFGEKATREGKNGKEAYDVESYNEQEIIRIAKTAFEIARKRNKKVVSVDKANVLESSRLWRKTVNEVSKKYEDVILEHMYVDNASMQLIKNPQQFDVILTSNMFGDILSDEASMITGSIGMLPSASLGEGNIGLYEPIHGSAPDIAGQNKSNPIATILSVAMMLRHSFDLEDEAKDIENAVVNVLSNNYRTIDIMDDKNKLVTTNEMGSLIMEKI